MPIIPARSYASQRLQVGQLLKIINTSGGQVIDTWAFASKPSPFPPYMSMAHTRSTPHQLLPQIRESFLDNRRAPILTLLEDTSPGLHDVLFAACSAERYIQIGASADHDNCANNLLRAIQATRDAQLDKVLEFLQYGWMPDPLNLFMKVRIEGNKLLNEKPESRPGDYVVLRAEQDCLVVMSACPMDVSDCNGGEPSEALFELV